MPSSARPGSEPPRRRALERAGRPLLVRLSALPGWLVPVITFALALVGLIVGGVVGFVALALIAVFLAWLAALSWPLLRPSQRLLRVLMIAVVVAAAAYQLTA